MLQLGAVPHSPGPSLRWGAGQGGWWVGGVTWWLGLVGDGDLHKADLTVVALKAVASQVLPCHDANHLSQKHDVTTACWKERHLTLSVTQLYCKSRLPVYCIYKEFNNNNNSIYSHFREYRLIHLVPQNATYILHEKPLN